MALRVCSEAGCPVLVPAGARGGRCPAHQRTQDRARGTRKQRGYDAKHDSLRRDYQRRMDEGQALTCWRCGKPIDPSNWQLGHDDHDRTQYRGPECPPCNLATSGRISREV